MSLSDIVHRRKKAAPRRYSAGLLFLLVFFLMCHCAYAQRSPVDSMIASLEDAEDTTKVNTMVDIGKKFMQKNNSSAVYYYTQAIELADQINYSFGKARAYNNLGKYYNQLDDIQNAINAFQTSLQVSRASGNQKMIFENCLELGNIFRAREKWVASVDYFIEAENNARLMNDSLRLAKALINIGFIYDEGQDDFKTAFRYYQEAFAIAERIEDVELIAMSAQNLAAILIIRAELYKQAQPYLEKSLRSYQEIDDPYGIADTYLNLGVVKYHDKNYLESIALTQKALDFYLEDQDDATLAVCYKNIADCYHRMELFPKAKEYALKAFACAERAESKIGMRDAATSLSDIYTKLSDIPEAFKYFKIATAFRDSLLQEDLGKKLGRAEEKFENEKQKMLEQQRLEVEASMIQRRDTMQNLLIAAVIFSVFGFIFFMKRAHINLRVLEVVVFIAFIMLFEFVNAMLDPVIESFSGGAPLIKIAVNVLMAVGITFLDSYLEKRVVPKD